MNILVEGSSYGLANVGDAAMLQVATKRLRKLWPGAKINVFSKNSDRLRLLDPTVSPLSLRGRDIWFDHPYLTSWTRPYLPRILSTFLTNREMLLKETEARFVPSLTYMKMRLHRENTQNLSSFLDSFARADLVVSSGGGFLNEAIGRHGSGIIKTIKYAIRKNIPTAMLGQGIGPIASRSLFSNLENVLPRVDLIALREKKYGLPLLRKIGAPARKIFITGDDAIELAYSLRPPEMGRMLGINIRVAEYAQMTEKAIKDVRHRLDTFRSENRVEMIPIPIDFPSDLTSIHDHFAELDSSFDFTLEAPPVESVINQAGRCRLIVTGSYHAAVFGLAQGIPSIGLANSDYYLNKFDGLQDMFGKGAAFVDMRRPASAEYLSTTLEYLWQNADDVRPALLAAARDQIERGNAAYAALKML